MQYLQDFVIEPFQPKNARYKQGPRSDKGKCHSYPTARAPRKDKGKRHRYPKNRIQKRNK